MAFDGIAQAVLLATLNKALIDFLAEPALRKWPGLDLWWLNYVALVTGCVIAWFAGVDFLSGAGWVADPLTARILSCLTVGAGTSLINTVFVGQGAGPATRTMYAERSDYRGW
jgi:type VI protein secretion system component VasK